MVQNNTLQRKLHSGTSKTKQPVPVHLEPPLFLSHTVQLVSQNACVILYHVTRLYKGPIIKSMSRDVSFATQFLLTRPPLPPLSAWKLVNNEFMTVYNSIEWDRTSAFEGASGYCYQSIFDLTHPPNPCMKCRMKLEIDHYTGNYLPCSFW